MANYEYADEIKKKKKKKVKKLRVKKRVKKVHGESLNLNGKRRRTC